MLHLRSSLSVTTGAANELTETYDKIRQLEFNLKKKDSAMRNQHVSHEQALVNLRLQNDALLDELEIFRANEK